MNQQSQNEIRSRPRPNCYLCSTPGAPLYEGLKDRLFGAPGEWNMKKCINPECGLVWLDPMPLEEDIGKAYQSYYTHHTNHFHDTNGRSSTSLRRMLRLVLRGAYKVMLRATPIHYGRKKPSLMYLDKNKPGRLLDIGCGDGWRAAQLRKLGWEVEGQEVDPIAAEYARSRHNIPIHLGTLEALELPSAKFDAVVMSHVLEHVHDPVALMAECHRILKPSGTLVATTPNVESYGHKYFGPYWRGLEPPRHLHVFSNKTLKRIALEAGFTKCATWTTAANAQVFVMESLGIKRHGHHEVKEQHRRPSHYALAVGYQLWATAFRSISENLGEECVLKVSK